MHCKNIFLLVIFFALAVAGCKKSETKPTPPLITPTPPHTGPDVYVAGYVIALNGHPVAAYWKNGVITKLADSTLVSEASSIIVVGSDIYVAGISSASNQANTTVTYWKNGVATRMPVIADLGISQSAFAINGSDLYMAGDLVVSNRNTANYWKNNVSTILPDNSQGSYAYGICTNGSDLYVTGYINGNSNFPTAAYWKNGVLSKLDDGSKYQTMAYAIKPFGTDIYVAGYREQITNVGQLVHATYWKNGVANVLMDPSVGSFGYDVAVSNNDVYVAGYGNNGTLSPGYWKNGVYTSLDITNAGSYSGPMTASIAVDNNDVYIVAGYPTYWKNSVPVQLAKIGGAMGIYVVPN